MDIDLTTGIVRILKGDNTVGTGFVLTNDGFIITCAHVVNKALGRSENTSDQPDVSVRLVFHHIGDQITTATIVPDGWREPKAEDIALLHLDKPLPQGIRPLAIGSAVNTNNHQFETFGFPDTNPDGGLWGTGDILRTTTIAGVQVLQLRSKEVAPGFSGAPVCDTTSQYVIGMVTAIADVDQYHRQGETAFATPLDTIVKVYPSLSAFLKPSFQAPFLAPELPPHFVPRIEAIREIKNNLLSDTDNNILAISAIHGMGGVGKSTLAMALAQDPEVKKHFSDGIFWTTLGRNPNIAIELQNWMVALNDPNFDRYSHPDNASNYLGKLLKGKDVLLVVDDVWDPTHIKPFITIKERSGSSCRVLITTREAQVTEAVGVKPYDLGVMTPEQALTLLTRQAGHELEGEERRQAQKLARTVGYLPLALELAAAQIVEGISWIELLTDLQNEIARLEALESPGVEDVTDEAERKKRSLRASFNLSLQRLKEAERHNFAWLGVLPEDATITPLLATTLWGKRDERAARDVLRYLYKKALLLRSIGHRDNEDETFSYQLHDLAHDMARRLLTAPPESTSSLELNLPGLGLKLPEAHAHLLKRYRMRTKNGLWHTLPEDGYIHTHLTWHLEEAGLIDELHILLREKDIEGKSGWYQACQRLGRTASFLRDVTRAWQLAEETFNRKQISSSSLLELQCRYAFIIASLNDMAQNIPPAMVAALVKEHVWTSTQGLAFAGQIPDPTRRIQTLTLLSTHLEEESLINETFQEALSATQTIPDEEKRVQALIYIAPQLPLSFLQRLLDIIRGVEQDTIRTKALAELTTLLIKQNHPDKALALVREIENKNERFQALINIVTNLPKPKQLEALQGAIKITQKIEQESTRVEMLICLICQLAELSYLSGIPNEIYNILIAVTSKISEQFQMRIWEELATKLAELKHSQQALEIARKIQDQTKRALVLAKLIPYLPGFEQKIRSEIEQIVDRTSLNIQIIQEIILELAIELIGINHPQEAIGILLKLEITEVMPEASKIRRELDEKFSSADRLDTFEEAIKIAQQIDDLQGKLQPDNIKQTIDRNHPQKALTKLILHLASKEDTQKLLQVVNKIKSSKDRIEVLAVLIPQFAKQYPDKNLEEEIQGLWPSTNSQLDDKISRETLIAQEDDILTTLIPQMVKSDHHKQVLELTKRIQSNEKRAKLLIEIASSDTSKDGRNKLLNEALSAIKKIESTATKVELLLKSGSIAKEPDFLEKNFLTVLEIQEDDERAVALAEIAPYLPENLLSSAVTAMRNFELDKNRVIVLASLAPRLDKTILVQELKARQTIRDMEGLNQLLIEIAPRLAKSNPQDALKTIRLIKDQSIRINKLTASVRYLPIFWKPIAFTEMAILLTIMFGGFIVGITPIIIRGVFATLKQLPRFLPFLIIGVLLILILILSPIILLIVVFWRLWERWKWGVIGVILFLSILLGVPQLKEWFSGFLLIIQQWFASSISFIRWLLPPTVNQLPSTQLDWKELLVYVLILFWLLLFFVGFLQVRMWVIENLPAIKKWLQGDAKTIAWGQEATIRLGKWLLKMLTMFGRWLLEMSKQLFLLMVIGISKYLSETQKKRVLLKVNAWTLMMKNENSQGKVLAKLVVKLAELGDGNPHSVRGRGYPQLAYTKAVKIRNEFWRTQALVGLVFQRLDQNDPRLALKATNSINTEPTQVQTLIKVAPRLLPVLYGEALTGAYKVNDEYWKLQALISLFPYISELQKYEVLQIILRVKNQSRRVRALAKIASCISDTLWVEVLNITQQAKTKSKRVQAIEELLPYLPKQLRFRMLVAVQKASANISLMV